MIMIHKLSFFTQNKTILSLTNLSSINQPSNIFSTWFIYTNNQLSIKKSQYITQNRNEIPKIINGNCLCHKNNLLCTISIIPTLYKNTSLFPYFTYYLYKYIEKHQINQIIFLNGKKWQQKKRKKNCWKEKFIFY